MLHPHRWNRPKNWRLHCQGQECGLASLPPTIRLANGRIPHTRFTTASSDTVVSFVTRMQFEVFGGLLTLRIMFVYFVHGLAPFSVLVWVCVCVCVSVWCVKLLSIYLSIYLSTMLLPRRYKTIRYDTIEQFNLDSKAEYSALSSTRSQKKKLKQTTPVPLWCSTG